MFQRLVTSVSQFFNIANKHMHSNVESNIPTRAIIQICDWTLPNLTRLHSCLLGNQCVEIHQIRLVSRIPLSMPAISDVIAEASERTSTHPTYVLYRVHLKSDTIVIQHWMFSSV